jgi:hypothetical protein
VSQGRTDTDALELTGLEAFVLALLDGELLVVPDDPDAAGDGTSGSTGS